MAETRYGALELLVTLTELIPKAVQGCPQWIPNLVQCCLEGMSEINDDVNGDWLERSASFILFFVTRRECFLVRII